MRKGKQLGKDNPFYGKHHTDETRKAISEKKRDVPNLKLAKPIIIDGVKYPSRSEAARQLNVSKPTIFKWLKTGKAKNSH